MASAPSNTCPCCGSSSIEEDSAYGVVVCTSCGTAIGDVLCSSYDSRPMPTNTFRSQHQPSAEQIRVFSEKSYSARKMEKLVKETKKKAVAMKLPSSKTAICVEQVKELCRREAVGARGLSAEVVSAALVYIAWKNENSCVSAWDMVNTGVKPNVLLKATSRLCNQHPDLLSVTQEEPLTDKQRLSLRLDRFSPIHGEERRRILEVAQEIWGMVLGLKVQDLHLRKIPINDYCILAVSLQYVTQKDLPKSEIALLSKNISMTEASVKTRIWLIKKALVSLAARCPCLEQEVKSRVIRTQNVQRYLNRLLQNKHYLSCEMELMREEEVNREEITGAERSGEEEEEGGGGDGTKKRRPRKRARKGVPSTLPVVFANEQVGEMGGGEEETLSDLDDEVAEYILTEEQVEMRKYLLSSNGENNDESLTHSD